MSQTLCYSYQCLARINMNSVKSVSYAGKNGTVTTVPAESLDDVISKSQCVGFMKRNRNKILVGVVLSVCVILSTAALVFSIGGRFSI